MKLVDRDGKASKAKALHDTPTPTIALGRGTPGARTTSTLTKQGPYSPPIINSEISKAGWPSGGNHPSETLLLHRKAIETIVTGHRRGIRSMRTSCSHDFLKNMLEREEKAKREQGVTGESEVVRLPVYYRDIPFDIGSLAAKRMNLQHSDMI